MSRAEVMEARGWLLFERGTMKDTYYTVEYLQYDKNEQEVRMT